MSKYPRHSRDVADLKEAAKTYVLPGSMPPHPVLSRTDQVWAIGSCFAENITAELRSRGIQTGLNVVSETTNSPALVLKSICDSAARDFIPAAKAAIITLGLAAEEHDGTWKPSTVAQVREQLSGIVANIRAINDQIGIFFTLSPVPLRRAPWSPSAVVADTISKSTLRAALAEYLSEKPRNVVYWPAYEIVRGLGLHRAGHFGADDNEQRHVSRDVVKVVVDLFIETWFKP
jgi:hypothetical protein